MYPAIFNESTQELILGYRLYTPSSDTKITQEPNSDKYPRSLRAYPRSIQ